MSLGPLLHYLVSPSVFIISLLLLFSSRATAAMSNGRVAVVTGANKGIGYCIAEQLGASNKFEHIVLGCRDSGLGATAVESIRAKLPPGVDVCCFPLVVGDAASHTAFCDALTSKFGKIDVLVNNAAFAFKGADPTPFKEQCKATLDVNYRGTVQLTQTLLPLVRKGDDSRIVNVASGAGKLSQVSDALQQRFTSPTLTIEELNSLVDQFEADVQSGNHSEKGWSNSNYGMSKLALIAATNVWAREEAANGIKVNSLCPGYCSTDMSSHKGPRSASDGARNAVIPATMENPPTGEFFSDYKVAKW